MLNDATCFREVYIVCGYTDLRSGMDRLAAVIEAKTGTSPYVPGALYLFCGRRLDRIKGLVWEGDGWLLLYKRLSESQFQWPRNAEEVQALTQQQFRWLMEGLTVTPKKAIKPVKPPNTPDSLCVKQRNFQQGNSCGSSACGGFFLLYGKEQDVRIRAALRSAEKFSQPWQKRLEGQLAPDKAPSFCRISYPSGFARNAGLC